MPSLPPSSPAHFTHVRCLPGWREGVLCQMNEEELWPQVPVPIQMCSTTTRLLVLEIFIGLIGHSTYYLFNNIVMGNGDIAVNKTGKNLCFHGTCVLKTRPDNEASQRAIWLITKREALWRRKEGVPGCHFKHSHQGKLPQKVTGVKAVRSL